MRHRQVLIADDEETTRYILHTTLVHWGYDVTVCKNGTEAYRVLREPEAPRLALLDWMMPGMDGVEICAELRKDKAAGPKYLVLLTTRSNKEDLIEGLRSGADDYVTKPFHMGELRARLLVGTRMLALNAELVERVAELTTAVERVKRLEGLLPICSYCKAVRNDQDYWEKVDEYFAEHASVRFAHTTCPSCEARLGESLQRSTEDAWTR